MKYNQLPKPEDSNFSLEELGATVVPPIYRVGEDPHNKEILVEGHRILTWKIEGNESQVAEIAGWSKLQHRFGDESGYLLLPVGTRNAKSALSGMEAWENEKSAIVSAAGNYLERIKEETGLTDYSFNWGSVGITPEQDVFIAPPNLVAPSVGEKQTWKDQVVEELSLLLQNDDTNRGLANEFGTKITNL